MSVPRSLVLTVILVLAGSVASADSKVDWSQYIDKDAKHSPAPASTPPAVVTQNAAPKSGKKQVATKPKSAKTKRGARRHR